MFMPLALVLAAAAPGSQWAVVPLGARGPDLGPAARSLESELPVAIPGASVAVSGEVRDRLGLPSPARAHVRERLEAAELLYFQMDLAGARRELGAALEGLRHAAGDVTTQQQLRAARLLGALLAIAGGGPQSAEAALREIAPLASADPTFEPDPALYPPELIAVWTRALEAIAVAPRGELLVRGAPGARVFVDGAASGLAGELVHLPAGPHRVVLTGTAHGGPARSLEHEVLVPDGGAVTLDVDLAAEAVDPESGELLPPGSEAGAALLAERVAARLGVHVLALWWGEDGKALHVAVAGAGEVRSGRVTVGEGGVEAAARELALFAAGREPASVRASAPVAAVGAAPARTPPALVAARWGAGAAAVILGGLGAYFVGDANQRQEDLGRQIDAQIDALGWISDPAGARGELRAIEGRKSLGGALVVGGAVLAAGTVALLLWDGGASSPPPAPTPGGLSASF